MKKTPLLAVCFAVLMVLIAVTPVLAVIPGWLGLPLVSLAVAPMLLLLTAWAPAADIESSVALFKPLVPATLLPAAWMLLQLVPVPLGSIENAVWRSAAAAFPEQETGHVSIDLGYTLRGLFAYLSLVSLAFITSVLTRNRDRAEIALSALCTITTFVAGELLLVVDFPFIIPANSPADLSDSLVAVAAFGAILNAAFVVRTTERYDKRNRRQQPPRNYLIQMLLGTLGAILCLTALIHSASYDILISVGFGLMVVGVLVLIRRRGLGRWTVATVGAAVLVTWGGVIALRLAANPSVSPLFRFAKPGPAEADAATLRMIADAHWAGGGVGSYQALAAMYRDSSGMPGATAINTVASMLLEWGDVGLLITFAILLQLLIVLVRGSLSRGRDSFYAAGAAACLVTVFCEAYCDGSFTDLTVQTPAAIIIGLGLSQTIGRQAA